MCNIVKQATDIVKQFNSMQMDETCSCALLTFDDSIDIDC